MDHLRTTNVAAAFNTEPKSTPARISTLWDAHDSIEIDTVWDKVKDDVEAAVRAFVRERRGVGTKEFEDEFAHEARIRRVLDEGYDHLKNATLEEAHVLLEVNDYEIVEVTELDDESPTL
ncbi:hypothetical protein MSP7336_02756 [Mycobacterium shimoidei]|uniref:Uncharacterized protein n=2 Tax=Mycobacterium shimoidei TaxID=29313 RepID=A0A375Z0A2_MYCSH|nr:hypothetical protein MSP7336_02756 [Mycobacterium shimoidei]